MFLSGENTKNNYFFGILATLSKFPFSSINPARFDNIFGLNENKFFFQVAIYP